MANIDVMYSSKTDQWATPDDFFKELDQEFHFNLDPCADEQNHKCEKYFTKEDNGLSKDWGGYRVFCNPPYGRAITDWVEKAYREGTKDNTIVVMLIPVKSDISLMCGVKIVVSFRFNKSIFFCAAHKASASRTTFLSLFNTCSTKDIVTLFFCIPLPIESME